MLRALRLDVACLCVMLAAGFAIAAEPARRDAHQTDAEANTAYGLVFCYAEMKTPLEFLQSTPCVTGVHWRCTREDDKFWYGDLHYPTENTVDYKRGGNDSAPQYYMVTDIAVKKQDGLPIDLKKFDGALILRDSKPQTPLAQRGDGTSYEVVGYEDKSRDDRAYNFLFANHKDLKYTPPKKQNAE